MRFKCLCVRTKQIPLCRQNKCPLCRTWILRASRHCVWGSARGNGCVFFLVGRGELVSPKASKPSVRELQAEARVELFALAILGLSDLADQHLSLQGVVIVGQVHFVFLFLLLSLVLLIIVLIFLLLLLL